MPARRRAVFVLRGRTPEITEVRLRSVEKAAAEVVGDGYYMTRRAVEYANERIVFGHPIGKNQGVQFPIAKVGRTTGP